MKWWRRKEHEPTTRIKVYESEPGLWIAQEETAWDGEWCYWRKFRGGTAAAAIAALRAHIREQNDSYARHARTAFVVPMSSAAASTTPTDPQEPTRVESFDELAYGYKEGAP